MKIKAFLFTAILAILLGVIGGIGYSSSFEKPVVASDEGNEIVVTSKGLAEKDGTTEDFNFKGKIKFPEEDKLPYTVGIVNDKVVDFFDTKMFHRLYADKSGKFVLELQVTDAEVITVDEPNNNLYLENLTANDKLNVTYGDNGKVEFISWQQDNLSYTLTVHSDKIDNDSKLYITNDNISITDGRVKLGSNSLINIINSINK